ncbi:hypothetical protein F441_10851 [Phytophthora nicotianae CJ01A1]|uniref:Uncharacterized protein n=4 Tax=Phytophthora nicotianae TaxID=4792 RepID=V9EZW9_PHYNI|nr:hypothetical protein F443_10940 [Phytophthora nicotianae P1569]ETL37794.1 hypothetical protein L916_10563 [Phytophthora nicotianae]ETO73024.1 hypothetical protein F444_10996 [Phytophthora nicotianae P1976]ETO73040.1 hypothetical protein F444_10994 [Phytophthora nicotianae P1976]ETP14183.1 hypothetical protein F441_10851 [Phytophthora nicotianae CJ01A1]
MVRSHIAEGSSKALIMGKRKLLQMLLLCSISRQK